MTTPIRRVLDLSHHNSVSNLQAVKNAGIWGIIHKATEGTSYTDDKYAPRKNGFLEIGLLWGAYHFFHPGSVQAQVDHFLRVVGEDDTTLYALDWEASSSGTATQSQAEDFCRKLETHIGEGRTVIYSGNVAKEQIHGVSTFLGARRLWLAQYGTNPTPQASWEDWWLWQYSDGQVGPQPQGCPGVSGYVDTNSWPKSQADLTAAWSGTGVAPIPPEPIPPEPVPVANEVDITIAVKGDVVVKVNGQVITINGGGGDGGISDNHRNITATVFQDNTTAYPPFDGITGTELAVSLPANIPDQAVRDRGVRVYCGSKSAVGRIRDKGPWMVDDTAYINTTTARPIAETCYQNKTPLPSGPNAGQVPTNDAGIDLSPALAAAIGIDGKGKVDWEFVEPSDLVA
jgi:lysozyme